jgi:adenosine deaminase CECR1
MSIHSKVLLSFIFLFITASNAATTIDLKASWFEQVKQTATDEQLYQFLYALPKGGDLHNHLSGAPLSEWWWESAINLEKNGGYEYYTKTQIKLCSGYGTHEFGLDQKLLLFRTVQKSNYDNFSPCEKSEYKGLSELNAEEKQGWLDAIRLDKVYEGRDEFFQAHWQRINDMQNNPYLMAELLVRNMQAFSDENVAYLEIMESPLGKVRANGESIPLNEVAQIFRDRLVQKDAVETGITVRLQAWILRFIPPAEQLLETMFQFVDDNRDLYIGINMVGREDNGKGYPARFLATMRKMRQKYPAIPLAIHGGEVDEPNYHVRDTLLLGAERIGHGLNLITDPEMMLLMRHGHYLVEINLISNLKLEYVSDYSEHPFPEYLRTGIPVALSTDDRGMWDSNLTDEYFVAVKEYNLSWDELVKLGRNSIEHAFIQTPIKEKLLEDYEKRVEKFKRHFERKGWNGLESVTPVSYSFMCNYYKLCLNQ